MSADGCDDASADGTHGLGKTGSGNRRWHAGNYQQHQHCDTLAAADQANHGHLRRAGAQHRGAGDDRHRRADHQDQISGADPLQAGTHRAKRPEVQNVQDSQHVHGCRRPKTGVDEPEPRERWHDVQAGL